MIRQLEHEKQGLTVELERERARSTELLSTDRERQAKTCRLEEELAECKSLIEQLEKEMGWARDGIIAAVKVLQNSQLLNEDQVFLQADKEDPGTPSCR